MDSDEDPPSLNLRKTNKLDGLEGEEFPCSTSVQEAEVDPFSTPNFPDEIILEILSRLPAKSLGKFKCVSKLWLSLISNPLFIKTHLAIASERDDLVHHGMIFEVHPSGRHSHLKQCSLSSIVYPSTDAALTSTTTSTTTAELSDSDYPMKCPGQSFRIVGSCNGLVSISVAKGKGVCLWNPCTKKYKILHDIGGERKHGRFDSFGFGYDELNDDYKVVRVCVKLKAGFKGEMNPYVNDVRVYSLKNDSWSQIGVCKDVAPAPCSMGYYAGGNLNWEATGDGDNKFLSLDLASDTYGEIEWPSSKQGLCEWSIGVLGGQLCLLYDYEDVNVEVWVMKEYGVKDSWMKIVSIPYIDFPEEFSFPLPVRLLSNGNILLIIRSVLVLYSPKSNTFRWYPRINKIDSVSVFVESLVSPDLHDGEQRQLQLNG